MKHKNLKLSVGIFLLALIAKTKEGFVNKNGAKK
jgi:hypothetical protein